MPANDPYYKNMTVEGQAKKQVRAIWPTIYRTINFFFFTFVNIIKGIISSAWKSLRLK